MTNEKLTIIRETFKNDETGELTPAITVIIDGNIKKVLDIIMEKKGYSDYPEVMRDIIFDGIQNFIKSNPI
ncbi:hypothetical protein H1Z61_16880 [Bacillus aquiflavi]|uniref:Uncharacterized protein n=1 Tax=Bacillus aquiflavi TaxID=2672567 RepID=A0A6B3W6X2_9BACI|nr:hypothetical protein [Bacillus aquiflavi]MBA4538754.1 hypothetical protein [Bacillus aquiflavi]NEY83154.1 hypothetical protein [Bacillus aquiflavi]